MAPAAEEVKVPFVEHVLLKCSQVLQGVSRYILSTSWDFSGDHLWSLGNVLGVFFEPRGYRLGTQFDCVL